MKLVDCHTHIKIGQEKEALALAERGLWQIVCATNPDDCDLVFDLEMEDRHIIGSYGLHPWYVDKFSKKSMDRWIEKGKFIGEIGLDTVWTPISLEEQIPAFIHQLKLAIELQKPVILHTKGAEELVLNYLREYTPPRAIVHWYSGDEKLLKDFVELGCYFTLGPDIWTNPRVQDVCKIVPIDRLLIETDGIDAVQWALGKEHDMKSIPEILTSTLSCGAAIRGMTVDNMSEAIFKNSMDIIGESI